MALRLVLVGALAAGATTYSVSLAAFAGPIPGLSHLILPRTFVVLVASAALLLQRRRWLALLPLVLAPAIPATLTFLTPRSAIDCTLLLLRLQSPQPVASGLLVALATATACILPAALRRAAAQEAHRTFAHGSAHWASRQDLKAASLLAPEGIVLGELPGPGWRRQRVVDSSDHHILLIMPPGAGKTTGPVISSLLTTSSTAVVLDPKGELWAATAGWRSSIGHRCIRFSPTTKGAAAWNPLDAIPRGPGEIAAVASLARNLITTSAESAESHWILSARTLMTALALHLLYSDSEPTTLSRMRDLLTLDPEDLFGVELGQAVHDPDYQHGWTDDLGGPTATHPEVARCASRFAATPDRERGSIVSTLASYLDLWADPLVAEATSRSDYSFASILASSQPKPTTIYATIPYHDLPRVAPLLRLWLAVMGQGLTARPPECQDRVEIIIDEFASLGRLPLAEDILAFLRGYGARCTLVVQDLRQITRLYGRAESITGNCQVHLAGATQQPETRDHLSRLAGASTRDIPTRSVSGSILSSKRQVTRSSSLIQRPLLTAGEVGALPPDVLLLLKRGYPPARIRRLRYFEDSRMFDRSQIPPPTES